MLTVAYIKHYKMLQKKKKKKDIPSRGSGRGRGRKSTEIVQASFSHLYLSASTLPTPHQQSIKKEPE